MKCKQITTISLFLLVLLINLGCGDRTKDRMYDQINGAAACYRRMNATHQTGCSSDRAGSTGIVHMVDDIEALKTIIKSGTGSSYIPVISVNLLTRETIAILKASSKINGLVTYKENETILDSYSHENKCPNNNFALNNTCDIEWNKPGTAILYEDFEFPIFYITDSEDLDKIKNCYQTFNNVSTDMHHERSMCSIELSSFMLGAVNTPTCRRRSSPFFNFNPVQFCDPLGGRSVWSSLFPVGNSTVQFTENTTLSQTVRDDMKYIIVTARLDTTSLFLDEVPGANNPATSIVTLLYLAKLLKSILPDYNNYDKNIMFILLTGESYDYIGSQRLVYDMGKEEFPSKTFTSVNDTFSSISLDDIHLIIEINQMSKTDTLFVHAHNEKPEIREYITKLNKYKNRMNLKETIGIIPPASLQTFIRSNPNISGLILTDHEKEYTNKFYNSMYDTAKEIRFEYYNRTEEIPKDSIQKHVANIGDILARSLYEEVTNKEIKIDVIEDLGLINELFNCYLKNASCKIHQVVGRKRLVEDPMGFYVGVSSQRSLGNIVTTFIGLTLSWLTADVVNATGPCPQVHSYVNKYYDMSKSMDDLNVTVCYRSCMNFTESVSPAFKIDDYDWSSNEYSSWSESSWRMINVRLFLKPSTAHENITVAIGSMVMVMSFIFVYFVNTRSHILFPAPISITPTRC